MDLEEYSEEGLSVHQFTDQTSNVAYRVIFCLPMILGNLIMLCVTACSRQLRQMPKHVIILSQSLCGVIYGIILMPLTIELFLEDAFLHHCSLYLALEVGFSVTTSVTSLLHVIHCVTWLSDVRDSDDDDNHRRKVTWGRVVVAWVVSIIVLAALHFMGSTTYKEDYTQLCWLEVTPAYERLILVLSFLPQAGLVVASCSVVVGYYVVNVKGGGKGIGRCHSDRLHRLPASSRKDAADLDGKDPGFLIRVRQRPPQRKCHDLRNDAVSKNVGKSRVVPSAPPAEIEEPIQDPREPDPDIASEASSCAKDLYRITASDEDNSSVTSECKTEPKGTVSHEVVVEETTHVSAVHEVDVDLTQRKLPEESTHPLPIDEDDDVKPTTRNQDILYGSSLEETYVDALDECYPTALLKTYADEDEKKKKGFSRGSGLKSKLRLIEDHSHQMDRGGTGRKDRDADSVCSFHSCDFDAGANFDHGGPNTSLKRVAKSDTRRSIEILDTETLGDWRAEGVHPRKGQARKSHPGSPAKKTPSSPGLDLGRGRKAAFPADAVCGCLLVLLCFLPFSLFSLEGWSCLQDCHRLHQVQAVVKGLFDAYFALLPAAWLLCPRVRAAFRPRMDCGSGCNVITGL